MKNSLSLIAMISVTAALLTLGGCTRTNSTPSLATRITGKWTMKNAAGNYTNYGVNRKDTTWFTTADYFNFQADGTLAILQDNVAHNGKWQITGDRLFITETGYMDFNGGFGLPVLTQTDLQLYDTATTSFSTTEQRLNLYR